MTKVEGAALFPLGKIVATPGFIREMHGPGVGGVTEALRRHMTGDWGDMDAHDKRTNNAALKAGERLLSAYTLSTGVRFYIITEADRSATTFLLPDEY